MVPAALIRAVLGLIPAALAYFLLGDTGTGSLIALGIGALSLLGPVGYVLRYLRFRYRIVAGELQVTAGIAVRTVQRIPLHRIRTVDISAKPVLRIFSLALLTIGTGQQVESGAGALTLDAIRAHEAAQLRAELLAGARRAAEARGEAVPPSAEATQDELSTGRADALAGGADAPDADSVAVGADGPAQAVEQQAERTVLRMDWGWLRFRLLSTWTLLVPTVLLGSAFQFGPLVGIDPDTWFDWFFGAVIGSVPPVVWVGALVLAVLLIGAIGGSLQFVEAWWGYRLVHEPEGRYLVRRGLLTTRSLTIDPERLRGVTLSEALTTRLLRGATLAPVVTGISAAQQMSESGAMTPTTTRTASAALARELLDEDVLAPERLAPGWLEAHPASARRRIVVRYQLRNLLLAAALGAAWWFWQWTPWLLLAPAVLAVLLVPAAIANGRTLGHRIQDGSLTARRGFFWRRTDVVQLRGISGAHVKQSMLQRRLGLASVVATTGAGEKHYTVVDVDLGTAARLATVLGGPQFAEDPERYLVTDHDAAAR
ncbi:PH domain-containing protein [Arenivirga flava]|uniref:YdbS-like PH domain-containing protein n=1 Tax=Arenivirga flava TaxID=1930060 RepID=A0AA37X810_9MICO|nr:PH domain-containing protein [Arenivirga flava]GMA26969.1 hypothetical protein GCM10025874_02220 [Arenivirga flava]